MKVTEKCDVYSFGVLALEVVHGKHPGDLINTILSSSTKNISDLVDQRIPFPSPKIEEVLVSILSTTKACLNADPVSRPTMRSVSQLLST